MRPSLVLAGLVAILVTIGTQAGADTLYKVIGADGTTTYTDRPPAEGKSATAMQFAEAPSTPLPPWVLKYQAELRKSMQARLAQAKQLDALGTVTLFSATWCGKCRQAKVYLRTKAISFYELDIDTPAGGRGYFEAGGKHGVPLITAGGKRLEGFSDGAYDYFFAAKK